MPAVEPKLKGFIGFVGAVAEYIVEVEGGGWDLSFRDSWI